MSPQIVKYNKRDTKPRIKITQKEIKCYKCISKRNKAALQRNLLSLKMLYLKSIRG